MAMACELMKISSTQSFLLIQSMRKLQVYDNDLS